MTDFDRVNMRVVNEQDDHTIKVFDNNDVETTINHVKSDRFPNWMNQAVKTVIDKYGVKSYDDKGKLLASIPHSTQSLETYNFIKTSIATREIHNYSPFKKPTDVEISDLVKIGASVKKVGNSTTHIRAGNKEVLHDFDQKMLEERTFEGTDLKYSLHQNFQTDPTGRLYAAYRQEINMKRNVKGNKMWYFRDENITDYHFKPATNIQAGNQALAQVPGSNKFEVYPNPAANELWVQLPNSLMIPNLLLRLKIY